MYRKKEQKINKPTERVKSTKKEKYCDKCFADSSHRKQHKLTHAVRTSYRCKYCVSAISSH